MMSAAPVKNILQALFVALSLFFAMGSSAQASEYGCKVLLCLSNPAGPKAVSECVPPITKLFSDMAKPKPPPFPTCDLAVNPQTGTSSYAQQTTAYFDACPTGMSALPSGTYAIQAGNPQSVYQGIGDDVNPYVLEAIGGYMGPMQKTCVGNPMGATTIYLPAEVGLIPQPAGVFDKVIVLDVASGSGRAIDVFIDNQLFRRVFW